MGPKKCSGTEPKINLVSKFCSLLHDVRPRIPTDTAFCITGTLVVQARPMSWSMFIKRENQRDRVSNGTQRLAAQNYDNGRSLLFLLHPQKTNPWTGPRDNAVYCPSCSSCRIFVRGGRLTGPRDNNRGSHSSALLCSSETGDPKTGQWKSISGGASLRGAREEQKKNEGRGEREKRKMCFISYRNIRHPYDDVG